MVLMINVCVPRMSNDEISVFLQSSEPSDKIIIPIITQIRIIIII